MPSSASSPSSTARPCWRCPAHRVLAPARGGQPHPLPDGLPLGGARQRGRVARERGPPGARSPGSTPSTPAWSSSRTPRSPEGPHAPASRRRRRWRTSDSWSPAGPAASARGGAALVREGVPVTVLASSGPDRPAGAHPLPAELAAVRTVKGDVTDVDALETIARDARVTSVIHLAALQLPLCAADPINGARVNVQGTAAMFELGATAGARAARVREQRRGLRAGFGLCHRRRRPGRAARADVPLRRVQDGQRAGGAGLRRRVGHREHRPAAALRVRPGP